MHARITPALFAVALLLVAAPAAHAHGGHGDPRWYGTALHYLFEPVHFPVVIAALAVLIASGRWIARQRAARGR